jgi:hypothetical protein
MVREKQVQVKVTITPAEGELLADLAAALHMPRATIAHLLLSEGLPKFAELVRRIVDEEQDGVLSYLRAIISQAQQQAEQLRIPYQFKTADEE